ncbi:MAG: extracellular solute-binding protein [Halanaerobiales bacterium]
MKRSFKKVLFSTLVFIFLLVSFGQVLAEEEIDTNTEYYTPMDETVTVTTGRQLPLEPKFPEGEDLENNDIVKWYEDNLNINFEVDWTVSDQNNSFENRVNMLIASNDLPDFLILLVEPQGLNILRKLVDNDMIMDMTDLWDENASPYLKKFHEESDNVAFKDVTFDGRLMAIPNLSDIETAAPIMWVRQDWLDNLGLEGPETVDDVIKIAKAFKEQDPDGNGVDDTIGLPGRQVLFKGDTASFDWVFGAYNAYPGDWINKDGKVVYGSVQPEAKAALAKIHEMYEAGIVDKEFLLKTGDDAVEPVMSGKAGIFQGAWWSTWWPLNSAIQNNPESEWKAYFIKSEDGNAYSRSYPAVRQIMVVRKDYEHPEAIMKMLNWSQLADMKQLDWYNNLVDPGGKYAETTTNIRPINGMSAKYLKEISIRYNQIMDVINGELDYDDATKETQSIVDTIRNWKAAEDPLADIGLWASAVSWLEGASTFAEYDIQFNIPAFSGTTRTMAQKNGILQDLENESYLQIIIGDRSIDEFDNFVNKWSTLGGNTITEEVNSIVAE